MQNRFPMPSWISDQNVFAIFYLQVTLMLSTKFGISWPFGSGEETKNRFSRWQPWWPSLISDQNGCSHFDLLSPRCFLPSFKTIGLSFQEKNGKIDFQDGGYGDHLGCLIETIATFYLQVIQILHTKFHVNWPFFTEEAKNRFS